MVTDLVVTKDFEIVTNVGWTLAAHCLKIGLVGEALFDS